MSQMIRARAVADGTIEVPPEKRIAAIAAKVRRPVAFATAQRAFADLQQRHGELRETLRNRIGELDAAGGEGANGSGPLIRAIRRPKKQVVDVYPFEFVSNEDLQRMLVSHDDLKNWRERPPHRS
jgi:hypothetical protein